MISLQYLKSPRSVLTVAGAGPEFREESLQWFTRSGKYWSSLKVAQKKVAYKDNNECEND